MGERIDFPGQGEIPEFDKKVEEISDLPQGPEGLLYGLTRIPNVAVDGMEIPTATLQDFKDKLTGISSVLGRKPRTLILCNAGVLRSKLLADYLFKEKLVELVNPNMNSRKNKARGLGVNGGLKDYIFDFSDEGLTIVGEGEKEDKIDLLILALAGGEKDPLDSQALGKMASFLDEGLKSTNGFKNPFNIFWINGIEEELEAWIPVVEKK